MARDGNSISTQASLLLTIGPQLLEVCLPKGAVTKNIKMWIRMAIPIQA